MCGHLNTSTHHVQRRPYDANEITSDAIVKHTNGGKLWAWRAVRLSFVWTFSLHTTHTTHPARTLVKRGSTSNTAFPAEITTNCHQQAA